MAGKSYSRGILARSSTGAEMRLVHPSPYMQNS